MATFFEQEAAARERSDPTVRIQFPADIGDAVSAGGVQYTADAKGFTELPVSAARQFTYMPEVLAQLKAQGINLN